MSLKSIYYRLPLAQDTKWRIHRNLRWLRGEIGEMSKERHYGRMVERFIGLSEKPAVLFAGYTRSGNTWFRLLLFNYLKQIYSSETGPMLVRELKRKQPHKFGEAALADVEREGFGLYPFLWTHMRYRRAFGSFKKRIYIVRNPLDCLVSNYHWFIRNRVDDRPLKVMALPGEEDRLRDVNYYVRVMYPDWAAHVKDWIRQDPLLVLYEELVEEPAEVLAGVVKYLDEAYCEEKLQNAIEWSDFGLMKQLSTEHGDERGMGSKEFKGHFFRKGKVGGYEEELSDGTIRHIKDNIRHDAVLRRYPSLDA